MPRSQPTGARRTENLNLPPRNDPPPCRHGCQRRYFRPLKTLRLLSRSPARPRWLNLQSPWPSPGAIPTTAFTNALMPLKPTTSSPATPRTSPSPTRIPGSSLADSCLNCWHDPRTKHSARSLCESLARWRGFPSDAWLLICDSFLAHEDGTAPLNLESQIVQSGDRRRQG